MKGDYEAACMIF